ncbi:MAG: hypothetical protein WBO29_01450 [Albidovulum sp.]
MPSHPKSQQGSKTDSAREPGSGVLIRAENGDVVTYDETGLTLRLSDTMLADLRARLGVQMDVTEWLGDIDAWNLRSDGAWLRFDGHLDSRLSPRQYQRPLGGGDIIAATPGPLYALFSLGGARRAGFNDGPPDFPFHVLAPGDHIGAVGLEGTAQAGATDQLQHLSTTTRDAMIGDCLLHWRKASGRSLPLFVARTETDGSADISALATGQAYANFVTALDNLVAIATSLGKSPKVLAVGLDYSLEDQHSDATTYAEGMRALMRRIERDLGRRGLQRPIFLATFETGTEHLQEHPSILGQWELAWSHGPHGFAFSAPAYMFEQTGFGRPTDNARLRMAEMDAHAIVALSAREKWTCPLFLLAEQDGQQITVTADALADIHLDPADPFKAGQACGFSITGTDAPVKITGVSLSKDDTKALILDCDTAPTGPAVTVHYALGGGGKNCGSVRDSWTMPSRGGGPDLHRWALPAILPVRSGAA